MGSDGLQPRDIVLQYAECNLHSRTWKDLLLMQFALLPIPPSRDIFPPATTSCCRFKHESFLYSLCSIATTSGGRKQLPPANHQCTHSYAFCGGSSQFIQQLCCQCEVHLGKVPASEGTTAATIGQGLSTDIFCQLPDNSRNLIPPSVEMVQLCQMKMYYLRETSSVNALRNFVGKTVQHRQGHDAEIYERKTDMVNKQIKTVVLQVKLTLHLSI